jgi:hypothetical protein
MMIRNRLLDTLRSRNSEKQDGEISRATEKIEKQERLSSQEFLKVYETIWQAGPTIKYENPCAREREEQLLGNVPNSS